MFSSSGIDTKFFAFCQDHGIKDPFEERYEILKHKDLFFLTVPEGKEWERKWRVKRDKYLRLKHTFRLWEKHFTMDWDKFQSEMEWAKDYADISIYCPCDCAGRQCSMWCRYFKGECKRGDKELENPVERVLKEEYGKTED